MEILPDSRARADKGAKFDAETGCWISPVFCANCGKKAGMAGGNVTHIFVLCDPCGEKYGTMGATYVPPDVVYGAKVQEAQIESFGRLLEPQEFAKAVSERHNPLAVLARDLTKLARRA